MTEHKEPKFGYRAEAQKYETPLLKRGTELENELSEKVENVKNYKSGLFGSTDKLKKELDQYLIYLNKVNEFRKETREYEYEITIGNSASTPGVLEVLFDINDHLEKKLNIYFELINRKTSEIHSIRLSYSNIAISFAAIIVSIIAIA